MIRKITRWTTAFLFVVIMTGQHFALGGDWIQNTNNAHWYKLTETTGSWNQVETEAVRAGGHLVTISDAPENEWLLQTFDPDTVNFWIGLYQPDGSSEPDGNWQWISGEPFAYTNWTSGEPNNNPSYGGENQAMFYGIRSAFPGQWNDQGTNQVKRGLIECRYPWVWNPDNNHWYKLTETTGTWSQTESEAVACGGHLVTIRNASECTWLVQTFDPQPYSGNFWIGLSQPVGSPEPAGNWQWVNGEPITYANWASGEPNNNGDEDHAYCYGKRSPWPGQWNDMAGANRLQYGVIERYGPTLAVWQAVEIGWATTSGTTYQVQSSVELATNTWQNLGAPILGAGGTNSVFDSMHNNKHKFYRVVIPW